MQQTYIAQTDEIGGEIMKWFNLSAIWKEISKIRWPKKADLLSNSIQVVIFTGFFALICFYPFLLVIASIPMPVMKTE